MLGEQGLKKSYRSRFVYITFLTIMVILFLSSMSSVYANGPLVCEPSSENLVLSSGSREKVKIKLMNKTKGIVKVEISDSAESTIDAKYPNEIFLRAGKENTITFTLYPEKQGNFNILVNFISKAYTGCPSCGWEEIGQTEVFIIGSIVSRDGLKPPAIQSPVEGSKDSPGLITKDRRIEISGQGLAGTAIKTYVGKSEIYSTTVNWDGSWDTTVTLPAGVNKIQTSTVYEGIESEKILYGYVAWDSEPPSLTIDTPENNIKTVEKSLKIEGRARDNISKPEDLKILIKSPGYLNSEKIKNLRPDGSFSIYTPLIKGNNHLSICVEDEAGFTKRVSLNVNRNTSTIGNKVNYLSISVVFITIAVILIIARNIGEFSRQRKGL